MTRNAYRERKAPATVQPARRRAQPALAIRRQRFHLQSRVPINAQERPAQILSEVWPSILIPLSSEFRKEDGFCVLSLSRPTSVRLGLPLPRYLAPTDEAQPLYVRTGESAIEKVRQRLAALVRALFVARIQPGRLLH